jgi:DNA-binding CsgD family transcriptional regulator/DNA-binding winged helix-turn-helix (wHTH) protein
MINEEYQRTMDAANKIDPSHIVITAREKEILFWMYTGKTNDEIGEIVKISGLTVKNHVQKILRKLNCINRMGAIYKGLQHGLLVAPKVTLHPKLIADQEETEESALSQVERLNKNLEEANLEKERQESAWFAPKDISNVNLNPLHRIFEFNGVKHAIDYRKLYNVLHTFMTHIDIPFSRQKMLDIAWGNEVYVEERTVDVYVRRLRQFLEKVGFTEYKITTLRSQGYVFTKATDELAYIEQQRRKAQESFRTEIRD